LGSSDAQAPACYYPGNDTTCTKDAISLWWDTTGSSGPCYEMAGDGRRHRPNEWPRSAPALTKGACNNYAPFGSISVTAPSTG
jgi:hypothetical protein